MLNKSFTSYLLLFGMTTGTGPRVAYNLNSYNCWIDEYKTFSGPTLPPKNWRWYNAFRLPQDAVRLLIGFVDLVNGVSVNVFSGQSLKQLAKEKRRRFVQQLQGC